MGGCGPRQLSRPTDVSGMKIICTLIALCSIAGSVIAAEGKLRAAFIYVGPVNDFGWTRAHDDARRQAQEKLGWLESSYVESVAEGDLQTCVDLAVQAGNQVIFTTSATYIDGTLEAAQRYPNIIFVNEGGFKSAANVASYLPDAYQCYYLFGLMAGALTNSNQIGYVSTYPGPDVKRFINAMALGLHVVKPGAVMRVTWINSWYDPPAAKEAAESVIAQGADVLVTDMDSPTVVQVAGAHHLPVFGHNFPMYDVAPDYVASGDIMHLEVLFENVLTKIHEGAWTPSNLQAAHEWCRLSDGVIEFGAKPGMPINPRFKEKLEAMTIGNGSDGTVSVYDLVLKRHQEMAATAIPFEPFSGPVIDSKGITRIPQGKRLTKEGIFDTNWRVPGILGPWPGEP
jgi:basic membrane protein A and related proteins